MVGANFRAILRYNNSTAYALVVGHLAGRLAGGPEIAGLWPTLKGESVVLDVGASIGADEGAC